MPAALFNPSPAHESALLDAVAAGHLTLPALADHFQTTAEALSLHISTGPFAARVASLATVNASCIRLAASMRLVDSLRLLTTLLNTLDDQIRTTEVDCSDPASLASSHRRTESARRVVAGIFRLSRFHPGSGASGALGGTGVPPVVRGTGVPPVVSSSPPAHNSPPADSSAAPDAPDGIPARPQPPVVMNPLSAAPVDSGSRASHPPTTHITTPQPAPPRPAPTVSNAPSPSTDLPSSEELLELAQQLEAFADLLEPTLPQPVS